jgi:polysaccharide export outer membrane protein
MIIPPQMHSLRRLFLAAGVTVASLLPGQAVAQTSTPAPAANPVTADPNLQRHPLNIEESQPSAQEEYLLGPGDDIVVTVSGRPELSGPQVVGPDGRITLPVVGSVVVAEKSREDAAKAIDAALSQAYTGVLTSVVQVTKYGSNHILILGSVEHTGVVNFDEPPSLLEAITRAGSLVNADHSVQMPKKCVIYRGDDKVLNVNISDRFANNRALMDIRLRRKDVVFFPENQESLVSVIGEVLHPGPERLAQNTTIISLLSAAGNITEKAGNNPEIAIVQPSTGRVQKVRFKDLLDPRKGSDIALHDGDIVFVPRSGLAKTGFVFSQISPILGIGTLVALVAP